MLSPRLKGFHLFPRTVLQQREPVSQALLPASSSGILLSNTASRSAVNASTAHAAFMFGDSHRVFLLVIESFEFSSMFVTFFALGIVLKDRVWVDSLELGLEVTSMLGERVGTATRMV